MLNENAKKWVAALRSGKYKQAAGWLTDGVGHCCLGVACELAIESGVPIEKAKIVYTVSQPDVIGFDGNPKTLPTSVVNWLRLRDRAGSYDKGSNALASDNDSGKTFEQIADIIESEPEGLFA